MPILSLIVQSFCRDQVIKFLFGKRPSNNQISEYWPFRLFPHKLPLFNTFPSRKHKSLTKFGSVFKLHWFYLIHYCTSRNLTSGTKYVIDTWVLCFLQYDTNRHLEWLKTVKESHGSVAMTSLVQAKTINSSGVYLVGHLDTEKGPSPEQGKRLSFKDVIRLTVPLKDRGEKKQRKTYSIDELKDLQSKLMLIAGKAEKGKDDVEQFVRVSENTIVLRKVFSSEVVAWYRIYSIERRGVF